MQQHKYKDENWETGRDKINRYRVLETGVDRKEAKEPKEIEREAEKTEILEHRFRNR